MEETTPPVKRAPSMQNLQLWVDNNLTEEAMMKIKEFGLPYEIVAGKVVHAGNSTEAWLDRFITIYPGLLKMKENVRILSGVQDEVLIVGETGTGKELLARALHGNRPANKFIAFNCAGVPETLIEADLFGHTSQAFTGARESKQGLLRAADDGTMFLDEIGEMPMSVQAKLLRALQEKKIRKLGSIVDESINCRIVCATNRNIKKMVDEGTFRRDLYARISTFEIDTIPLRNRPLDVAAILKSMDGGEELLSKLQSDPTAIDVSLNVRSLQQHVRRYKVLGILPYVMLD